MACGSVYAAETRLTRDLSKLEVTRQDLNTKLPPSPVRNGDVHEAVRFLQAEHEKVLSGLHQEIQSLQRRCDDLQFEAHLSHVTAPGEQKLQKQINDLTEKLKKQTLRAESLDKELEEHKTYLEEVKEQQRWKEIQLKQQIEVGEHKTTELKAELAKLKSQIHDLRVYNSALRNGNKSNQGSSVKPPGNNWNPSNTGPSLARSVSRSSRASLESLDSGPQSLGSEDGEIGTWKEARLGSSISLHSSNKITKPTRSLSGRLHSSLPPFIHSPSTPNLPSLASSSSSYSRPSTSVTLPPISQTQNVTRPHVRRQLRLSSAPVLNQSYNKGKPDKDPL